MKVLATAILAVFLLSASWIGWHVYVQPDHFIVGGSYVLRPGEVLDGDVDVLFAQFTVQDGASVAGRIRSLSSVIDVAGSIQGSILLVGSDVITRPTATLSEKPHEIKAIRYVVLLPRLARA